MSNSIDEETDGVSQPKKSSSESVTPLTMISLPQSILTNVSQAPFLALGFRLARPYATDNVHNTLASSIDTVARPPPFWSESYPSYRVSSGATVLDESEGKRSETSDGGSEGGCGSVAVDDVRCTK
jgi:hypothetical protein